MSELSPAARDLADTLCGSDFVAEDNGISRYEQIGGERMRTIRYEKETLLRVASAALELAGYTAEVEHEENNDHYHCCKYKCVGLELYRVDHGAPTVEVFYKGRNMKALPHLAAILLHAAQTAAAWESEGE